MRAWLIPAFLPMLSHQLGLHTTTSNESDLSSSAVPMKIWSLNPKRDGFGATQSSRRAGTSGLKMLLRSGFMCRGRFAQLIQRVTRFGSNVFMWILQSSSNGEYGVSFRITGAFHRQIPQFSNGSFSDTEVIVAYSVRDCLQRPRIFRAPSPKSKQRFAASPRVGVLDRGEEFLIAEQLDALHCFAPVPLFRGFLVAYRQGHIANDEDSGGVVGYRRLFVLHGPIVPQDQTGVGAAHRTSSAALSYLAPALRRQEIRPRSVSLRSLRRSCGIVL